MKQFTEMTVWYASMAMSYAYMITAIRFRTIGLIWRLEAHTKLMVYKKEIELNNLQGLKTLLFKRLKCIKYNTANDFKSR